MSVVRLFVASILAFLLTTPAVAARVEFTGKAVPNEVIVKVRGDASATDILGIEDLADADASQRIATLSTGTLLRLRSASKSAEAMAAALGANQHVELVEPNSIVRIAATPNDPSYGQLYGLRNTGQTISSTPGSAGADIDAEAAWNVTTGTQSVVVAVIDTGVDYNHPDLAANMWSNPGGKGNAACAAGTHGFNSLTGTCNPMDDYGHGTHVAGTIGAVGNNGVGVAGVNWTTSIMALKFIDFWGNGTVAGAIAAIDFAIQAKIDGVNVRVLSNSWGGFPFSRALLDVINRANEHDILFVASAGNSSRNTDAVPHFPSSYGTANMLSVASTDNRDGLSSFSNYGAATVHLGAPGTNVYSTVPGGGYNWSSGTSMAAPHVSGVAALVLAQFPGYTTAQVKSAILDNTDPLPALAGRTVTGGRLNAAKALGATPAPDFSITMTPSVRSITQGGAAQYTVTINRYNGLSGTVDLALSTVPAGATATFTPPSATTTATLTVVTSSATPSNAYTLTVSGTAGSLTKLAGATLWVNPAPAAGACPSFIGSAGSYLYSPSAVAAGDFNDDGRTDYAAADTNMNLLYVYRRGFSAAAYPVGRTPASIAAGDFNGDGRTDLVTANASSNDVSVLFGNGTSGFDAAVAFAAGTSPLSVAAGDFNRDGRADLAVANNGSGNVSVLLGQSGGTLAAAVHYATGSGPFWVTVTDADRDGRDDLAVANSNAGTVSLLRGNGDGTFSSPQQATAGTKPSSIAAADFTGDGAIDLAVSNYGSNDVSLLSGNGDGTFAAGGTFATGSKPVSVAAGDLDGNGKLDLVTANEGSANISILLAAGFGSFGSATHSSVSSAPSQARIGDIDDDGRPDILAAVPEYGRVAFFFNQSTCALNCGNLAGESHAAGGTPQAAAAADFNRDGKPDLAVLDSASNNVGIRLGNGDGTFTAGVSVSAGTAPLGLAAADFNRDGKPDLAVASTGSNQVAILAGNGDGTFQSAVSFATGTAPRSVTAADLDRDGRLDLAVPARDANSISVLRGNGDGTFQAFASYATGTSPRAAAAADFNRDGVLDLATANAGSASVSVLLGNGNGTFQAAVHYGAGTTPRALIAADLDADGRVDLATANFGSNDVSVLFGNGDGTFDPAAPFAAGTGPAGIAAIDLNGDGLRDLVTANQSSHDASVLFAISGGGTFAAPVGTATGLSPVALTGADFDRDGKTDVAVANSAGASFSLLRNTCPVPDLTVMKTHSGTFSQGGTGSYTITVSNAGLIATSGIVTVTDTLPSGLSATGMSGTGWTCVAGTGTCTRSDALAPGASYPPVTLAVRIHSGAPANVTNTVTVSGGGEVDTTNSTATDPASVVPMTDLFLIKSHTGAFAQGATGRKYSLVVRNGGGLATSGTVTVTDTLPAGLGATAMSGPGWSCNVGSLTCTRNDALAGGGSFPAIAVTVNVAANAPALIVNSATVSGGGDVSPANNTATDPTTVWSTNTCASFGAPEYYSGAGPVIALGDFNNDGKVDVAGGGTYNQTLAIRLGAGDGTFHPAVPITAPSTSAIATGDLDRDGDLDLVVGSYESDSRFSVLLGNGDGTFASAVHYDSTVSWEIGRLELTDIDGDGDLDVAAFAWSVDATLVLLGNGDGSLRPTVAFDHTEDVQAWTVADVTGDARPDLLTATSDTLFVRPGSGDGTFDDAISSPMSLSVVGLTTGDFNGDGMQDVAGVAYSDAIVLPGNGDGTFDAGLVHDINYSSTYITTADLNADSVLDLVAASSSGYISTALGNGDGTFQTSSIYYLSTAYRVAVTDFNGDGRPDLAFGGYSTEFGVMLGGCADVTVTKTHNGDFNVGETGIYTIKVSSTGAVASGTFTVTDTLPQGLTATSMFGYPFNCNLSTLTCTYTGTLHPGYYIQIDLWVTASAAAPASVVNTVTVSGGGDSNPANNTATDPTNIIRAADLVITKTHTGSVWTPGQNGTYTISVGNNGSGPNSGTVTVTDNLPWPFNYVSMSGPGWTCQPFTCTRNDALAPTAVYPPITLVVSVSPGATSVTNVATVSGSGDVRPWNNSASDFTRILSAPANVVATASSASQVTVTWNASAASGTQFEIHRSANGGAYTHVGNTLGLSYIDTAVTANTVYLYKVRLAEGGVTGPFSLSDVTNTLAYTDDPVVARVTRIKRVHIEELRNAVNSSRTAAGMSAKTFTDPSLAGVRIRKVNVTELRTAINELRDFLGIGGVVFEDSTAIKAVHINALRTALR